MSDRYVWPFVYWVRSFFQKIILILINSVFIGDILSAGFLIENINECLQRRLYDSVQIHGHKNQQTKKLNVLRLTLIYIFSIIDLNVGK